MYNYSLKTDYRFKIHKLSVGKNNLKLHLKHSKRNNSKKKHKLNPHYINNENNLQNSELNSNLNNNNSRLTNHRNVLKDQSKENRNPKNINLNINTRGKLLSINSLNNYFTNENNDSKKIKNDINISENAITNFSNNIDKNKKTNSVEKKQNIIVNKLKNNNNNSYNNANMSNNLFNIIKEKIMREEKDKYKFKKKKRDLSAKERQDNFNFNKKYYLKDGGHNNSNNNYSPILESNERKCSLKSNVNDINSINLYSVNIQKIKNKIPNLNTISNNANVSNFNTNNSSINNNNYNHTQTQTQTNPNNDEQLFEYIIDKSQELTKDEKTIYGDRIMHGCIKKKLLGKGGCGVVWECEKSKDTPTIPHPPFAVKQISKKNGKGVLNMANENIATAKNEIKILTKLNESSSEYIPRIFEYFEDNNDLWFSFEKGGISLSSLCFKIKGEFEKGERIYHIQKGVFLMSLFKNLSQFKLLLKSLLLGINYINTTGIIHSDIKPENILIEYNGSYLERNFEIKSVKIIDYGSAFFFNNSSNICSNTPEYLCPEITIGNKKFMKELKNNNLKYVNCIDIWSLGITFLELCLCCPTWMSYKTKVIINGKNYHSSGLFGCRGRDSNKIYQKQIELSKNINKKLKNSMLYLFEQNDRNNFVDLLKKMLEFDYRKRINCKDAINHEFFKD